MIKQNIIRSIKLICLSIILISCNMFAAVGGNDGSAFVTKAEFDALVNTFNEQMDNYESSMISKIDGSIANYLSGLSTASTSLRQILLPGSVGVGVLSVSDKAKIDYDYGIPSFNGTAVRTDFRAGYTNHYSSGLRIYINNIKTTDEYKIKKTVVNNIKDSETALKSTARWDGYYEDCYDTIYLSYAEINDAYNAVGTLDMSALWSVQYNAIFKNSNDFIGHNKILYSVRCTNSYGAEANTGLLYVISPSSIEHTWKNNTVPYVSILKPYDYDMFSNKDEDRNFNYDGSYMTNFDGRTWNNKVYSQSTAAYGPVIRDDVFQKAFGSVSVTFNRGFTEATLQSNLMNTSNMICARKDTNSRLYIPMVGFETTYLTNWKQIYDGNTKAVATFESSTHGTETKTMKAILTDSNGEAYMSLASGYPLIKLNKDEKLSYNLNFTDLSKNYVVWISTRPFDLDGHPDDDENCIEVEGLSKASNTNRGYLVTNGTGSFNTKMMNEDCILYLKWGIYNSTKANIAGGRFLPESEGTITREN